MSDYIEREDAIKRIKETKCKKCSDIGLCGNCAVLTAIRLFEELPAADVAPVRHGRWVTPTVINGRSFKVPHCSACDGVPCGVDENTKFCPNCGARMEGDGNA